MNEPLQIEQKIKLEKSLTDIALQTIKQKKQALKKRIDEIEYQRELKRIAEGWE